mmetsp:Transcript_55684/g.121232  ORF Transcript_55684/g.121232 Transcript_55684/m.121232 type:complete len:211 (+) Transcript_55684:1326-1958(+)
MKAVARPAPQRQPQCSLIRIKTSGSISLRRSLFRNRNRRAWLRGRSRGRVVTASSRRRPRLSRPTRRPTRCKRTGLPWRQQTPTNRRRTRTTPSASRRSRARSGARRLPLLLRNGQQRRRREPPLWAWSEDMPQRRRVSWRQRRRLHLLQRRSLPAPSPSWMRKNARSRPSRETRRCSLRATGGRIICFACHHIAYLPPTLRRMPWSGAH